MDNKWITRDNKSKYNTVDKKVKNKNGSQVDNKR